MDYTINVDLFYIFSIMFWLGLSGLVILLLRYLFKMPELSEYGALVVDILKNKPLTIPNNLEVYCENLKIIRKHAVGGYDSMVRVPVSVRIAISNDLISLNRRDEYEINKIIEPYFHTLAKEAESKNYNEILNKLKSMKGTS